MQEPLQTIEELLARREIKKVEIVIARYLRSKMPDPDRAKALIYRARVRLLSTRLEDAINDLAAARALINDNFEKPDLLELSGDCYFARFEQAAVGFADRNDTSLAQGYYQQIIKTFPTYENLGWIHYQLGRIALTDNHIDEAEHSFRQSLFTPSHISQLTAYCYERLGFIAFYERRDFNTALGFLNKAVDTYPARESRIWLVQVHTLRSRVLREMRHYEQALAAAEEAVSIATQSWPDSKTSLIEALLTASELLAGLDGRERDVVNYLQQFLQIAKKPLGVDVTWSRVHEMLGDAYFKLGEYGTAAESFQAALQFNPYHPWEVSLHYRIARSCYQRHDYEAAVSAINRMLQAAEVEGESVNDYRVYDILGNAQFALKHYPEAVEAYQLALQIAPSNAENIDKIKTYYQFAKDLS